MVPSLFTSRPDCAVLYGTHKRHLSMFCSLVFPLMASVMSFWASHVFGARDPHLLATPHRFLVDTLRGSPFITSVAALGPTPSGCGYASSARLLLGPAPSALLHLESVFSPVGWLCSLARLHAHPFRRLSPATHVGGLPVSCCLHVLVLSVANQGLRTSLSTVRLRSC